MAERLSKLPSIEKIRRFFPRLSNSSPERKACRALLMSASVAIEQYSP